MFSVSSDYQFGFKHGLSSSHTIYTVKSIVNDYLHYVWWHFVQIPTLTLGFDSPHFVGPGFDGRTTGHNIML